MIIQIKKPIFNKKQLFLKVLVEGKANLYEYIEGNLKRYFYKSEDSKITQLVFKTYRTTEDEIGENNRFWQQLWNDLKCPNFKMSKFKSLDYKKNNLVNLFVEYNECHNQNGANFEKRLKRDLFNLNIRPRVINSSLAINLSSDVRDVDFGNKTSFGIGIEAEFILSFNKNKWAIIMEPTYQNFKSEKTEDVGSYFGGELTTIINYNSIELPVGIRY